MKAAHICAMLDAETCHAAMDARDRRFDGRFFVGVTSTGIYCRCICSARTPKRANRRFFASAAAAETAGFRPCLLCRPELAPGFSPVDAPARIAAQAFIRIEAGAIEECGVTGLAAQVGVTERHLRRVMKAHYGASPIEVAQTSRLLAAKRLLADTSLPITEIAFASGFQSLRRFNSSIRARYGMSPTRMRARSASSAQAAVQLALSARGPYNHASVFGFLAARAMPGVETVSARGYARVLQIGDATGWIGVAPSERALSLTISDSLIPKLRQLVPAVRGAFDLDADCASIDAQLASDERFAPGVAGQSGVRIAGGVDGFEIAVRAVLGQQISLVAALKLTQRICENYGENVEGAPEGLRRTFPRAARLADSGTSALAALGMPRKRAETLHRLAVAVTEGRLLLARGAIAAGREGLAEIPGIGPWTIEYVALRALGDPDAYPVRDAALVAALGGKSDALEGLRPWRGYAAMRLWSLGATRVSGKGAKS